MFLELGEIRKSFWDKNGDAETKTQLFQTQLTEDDDTQVVEEMHIPGVQYKPPDNSRTFVARITRAFKIAVGVDDNVPKLETLNKGERISYASDSGTIVCSIKYNADGSLDIDADSDINITSSGDINIEASAVNVNNCDVVVTTGDVIADGISLKTHFHQGNLGFPTGAPIQAGGGTTPGSLPIADATGEITDGLGVKSKNHAHPINAGSSAPGPTGVAT